MHFDQSLYQATNTHFGPTQLNVPAVPACLQQGWLVYNLTSLLPPPPTQVPASPSGLKPPFFQGNEHEASGVCAIGQVGF